MRKDEYNRRTSKMLIHIFDNMQRYLSHYIQDENLRRYKRGSGQSATQAKHGSYAFIPMPSRRILSTLMKAYDYLWKRSSSRQELSFLDAGCGVGNIMLLARAVGFDAYGLELDPTTIRFAKIINPFWKDIQKQNILTYLSYGEFDVVYYYCPFNNMRKEAQFEKRVEDQMKIGALLIGKPSWWKDKRFRKLTFRQIGGSIYKKVKE